METTKGKLMAAGCPDDCAQQIASHPKAATLAPFLSLLIVLATKLGPIVWQEVGPIVWQEVLAWLNQQQ